ncbi:MAG: DUF2147 domain-containing protein [Bacteroidetes bacterium]|nr:DUF2147 domain-containing protein [Bacteroidota bacterium]MBU1761938.1 DUF2147 domain-containing protein [Bacteroidota bacterium]
MLIVWFVPKAGVTPITTAENLILGRWISLQKNVIVEIYKENNEFKAKVCWFNDDDNPAKPMAMRTDLHNPDVNLRSRKIIGLDILKELTYNSQSQRWEGGMIYDPLSGREWSSVVYFSDDGLLQVKGFWHFEFISKTMTFKRLSS